MRDSSGFLAVSHAAISEFGAEAALVLAHITNKINWHQRRGCTTVWFHSQAALADELGMTRHRVRVAVTKLVAAGALLVTKAVGPNRTDGWSVGADNQPVTGRKSVGECRQPVGAYNQPVGAYNQPTKQETKEERKTSKQGVGLLACPSSELDPLAKAIASKPLSDSSRAQILAIAKAKNCTEAEFEELWQRAKARANRNPVGYLRTVLVQDGVNSLRHRMAVATTQITADQIETHAHLLISQLKQLGPYAHYGDGLDRTTGQYRLANGFAFDLTMPTEQLKAKIARYCMQNAQKRA